MDSNSVEKTIAAIGLRSYPPGAGAAHLSHPPGHPVVPVPLLHLLRRPDRRAGHRLLPVLLRQHRPGHHPGHPARQVPVEPDLRGAGIGSLLMNDIEKRALDSGSVRLSLDVSAKNEGAKKLYKHREMTEASEWPRTRFLPSVFVRMSKNLL